SSYWLGWVIVEAGSGDCHDTIYAYSGQSYRKTQLFYSQNGSSYGYDDTAVHHHGVVCTSKECVLIAGFFAGNLNDKIDPCEDFYEYACGNYGLDRYLSANKPLRHTLTDMQNRLNKQVKLLLESPIKRTDKPWNRLAKRYYQQCIQEDDLEKTGDITVKEVLKELGGWPVLEGENWTEWTVSWEEQLARVMNKTGINAVILELSVSHDPRNSSKSLIELDQPKWGIGSRWPYLTGPHDPTLLNYTSLMIATAVNLGADPVTAERDMKDAIDFEVRLVNFSTDDQSRRDPDHTNNPYQLWQLRELFPHINFSKYVSTIFNGIANITQNDTVIIREMEYFRGIQHVLHTTSKRVIANYLQWRIVQGFSPFLPPKKQRPFYEFKANQTGIRDAPLPERWEDCLFLSLIMLDMPVGKLYVDNYFDKERAMVKMNEMTKYFKNELILQLRKSDWMDSTTRQRAIEKAEYVEYKSGYPPYIYNETWMKAIWTFPEIPNKPESLLKLTIRIKLARVLEELNRLKVPFDRSTWFQGPAQVDAYYAPNLNEMRRRYDKLGNLYDWWDTETAEKFFDRTECFVKQYNSIRVQEAGLNLNGKLSVGENIADNGGVKIALMAYKSWLKDHTGGEAALPGFQNFTTEQLFFLAYANNWCSMARPKHYVQVIMNDVHAPSKYRAIVPLQNRPEFAEAYHCKLGSPMNPLKKCALW
uniref:Neprilysin n=1 Tax=Syphacia muris TaxID=451379 RepID=A0A0N5AXE2_9BILA